MRFEKPILDGRRASLIFLWMTVYLLVFSSLALHHAYAENELFDTHACAVGEWVQHGHAILGFVAALAVFIPLVSKRKCLLQSCFERITFALDFSRGPPS